MKLFLDRATELMIAGNRPSAFANIKVAAKKDGTITAWQSQIVGHRRLRRGRHRRRCPYVFTEIPNKRLNHTAVAVNAGPLARLARAQPSAGFVPHLLARSRIWRPSCAWIRSSCSSRTCGYTARAKHLQAQLAEGRGTHGVEEALASARRRRAAPVKRGLGLAINTWGGGGHASQCRTTINPDGSVVLEIGTQDLGTGTRTVIAMVAAETLGLPLGAIKLRIGDSDYPPDGASGGSTTVGGVSPSTLQSHHERAGISCSTRWRRRWARRPINSRRVGRPHPA